MPPATYRVPVRETWQLQNGDPHGGLNCTAWAANALLLRVTSGKKDSSGTRIRALSSEPQPNTQSPGLSLGQVADVLEDYYKIAVDVRVGWRSVTWDHYEEQRRNGKPAIIQVGYGPIANSSYDAGRGFRGNHAIFEDNSTTYDPLADGRRPGVHVNDGRLYPRDLMRSAAERLAVGPHRWAGRDHVWCAFGADILPPYVVSVQPKTGAATRSFRYYQIANGRISGYITKKTKGFKADCNPPRLFQWPGHESRFLVYVNTGPHAGHWLNATWSHEK